MTNKIRRFWEIDTLRGIAIVVMIIFHTLYDLNYFKLYKIELYSIPLFLFFLPFAVIFLSLVGISLTLSYSRASKILTKRQLQIKYLKRGLKIFGLGLLITLATWIYLDEGFVIFGALHCIGTSIILVYPFLQFRYKNLLIGIILILAGLFVDPDSNATMYTLLGIGAVIIVIILIKTAGVVGWSSGYWWQNNWPIVAGAVFILIVIGVIVGSAKGETESSKSVLAQLLRGETPKT